MAAKSKRKRSGQEQAKPATKKARLPGSATSDTPVQRDLLNPSYATVQPLRQFLLTKLPGSSRLRRKKITHLGQDNDCRELEKLVAKVLDSTLVCSAKQDELQNEKEELRWQQWLSFSQKGDESYVSVSEGPEGPLYCQSEIVDFVIWLLFTREKSASWPKHLLCDGFRRGTGDGEHTGTTVPGVFCRFPNSSVVMLKKEPWPQILALLGKAGERAMIDLLYDCSIFVPVKAGFGNYYQINGYPLSEMDLTRSPSNLLNNVPKVNVINRQPSEIALVRSRIFYAKPTLTARGLVQAGFKHIHVLNRCQITSINAALRSDQISAIKTKNEHHTIKVMMYIFPRQFKLHNVFTSEVDRTKTAQKFQDYTLREGEIASQPNAQAQEKVVPKIPKRLRGMAKRLVERLQTRHKRCSYTELLRHYCPSSFDPQNVSSGSTSQGAREYTQTRPVATTKPGQCQRRSRSKKGVRKYQSQLRSQAPPQFDSVVELACPVAHVSAFCQAVLSRIIPNSFWGEGDTMQHNKKLFLRKVHHFIKLRRFETMSLHEIVQGFKIADIPWLQPPNLINQKTSQTDINKRYEIFNEFLFYVFDSLLMPLIRSNFYVTESNTHRYQVFYYRHDVWKRIAEPAMAALKHKMFEEVKSSDATRVLASRALGFSQIRLLPKGHDLRPITNLRRRSLARGGSKNLGPSINTILGPVHTVLKLEKSINPSKLGATIFSVNGMYTKLKHFKSGLGKDHPPLYLAKIDVQAAFDTIPQEAVVRLMASVPSRREYTITKHAEVKPGERAVVEANKPATRPIRKWQATASGPSDRSDFANRLEKRLAPQKKNTAFVDSAVWKTHGAIGLLDLLAEHVTQNLVKIGKKYYRQKTGIPQGSVLSSFLCNYFYADLEIRHLGFLNGSDCLLLRLIDDFLLITTDKSKAVRFVDIMHQGLPEYGVKVNPKKTLVNFDMIESEGALRKISKGDKFPYCGTLIDPVTLEITKDRDLRKNLDISTSLTVDFGRAPGQNFERKVLSAFKIQSHLMFFDTEHNSIRTVLSTLYSAFTETAAKMWAYIRCMPRQTQPRASLVIRVIIKVIDVAFLLLTSKSRKMRYEEYSCDVRKSQVARTACRAFQDLLRKKQAGYTEVINWLQKELVRLK